MHTLGINCTIATVVQLVKGRSCRQLPSR